MEKKELWIEDGYVTIPVWAGQPLEKLEIFCGGEDGRAKKVFEFRVPSGPPESGAEKSFDAYLPVKSFVGRKMTFSGNFSARFFQGIQNTAEKPSQDGGAKDAKRPSLHFAVRTGWINDPNGLVYHNGVYHLYFQYNPFDVNWENMCWGHAVSTDLLHWEELDPVMFPDENGTMFSGSGIVNERECLGLQRDALVFFYTAAAGCNDWTQEKAFTQRTAVSTDGGQTLVKIDRGVVPPVGEESRDPKVFWHEESQAYVMVLWLYEDVFGIFRSEDLAAWQESDRVKLEKGWECPDLFSLVDEEGQKRWMFLTADGYYYLGEFDGYRFRQTAERRCAYMNKGPYAAQTYSNVKDRRLLVAWLRLSFAGENYAGAMSLPRELSLTGAGENARLCLKPAGELAAWFEQQGTGQPKKSDAACCCGSGTDAGQPQSCDVQAGVAYLSVDCEDAKGQYCWDVCGNEISYDGAVGVFAVNGESTTIPAGIGDFAFFLDGPILEVSADHDTLFAAFEIKSGK